jgi:hypothetical protein
VSQAFCVLTAEQSRYFAAELRKTRQPLWGVGPVLTLYRLAVWPVRTLLNLWVRVFFLGARLLTTARPTLWLCCVKGADGG